MLSFPGYFSPSASLASQRVVLLGFSPSTIESSPNRQIHQQYWRAPTIIARLVRAASSVQGAISSRIPKDRASSLWVPSFISYRTLSGTPSSFQPLSCRSTLIFCSVFSILRSTRLLITTFAPQCVPGCASSSRPSGFTFPFGYPILDASDFRLAEEGSSTCAAIPLNRQLSLPSHFRGMRRH